MPSLFVPGVPLTADQFNARIRDEVAARRVPSSWGEFSDNTTQSVSSGTNHSPYEVSTSLDASDEQWANDFDNTFTSRADIPSAGLYLFVAYGNFASGGSSDFAVTVKIKTGVDTRVLGSAIQHGGGSVRNSFSMATVAPVPEGSAYAMVGQASGVSLNLSQFGLWITKLSDQALY